MAPREEPPPKVDAWGNITFADGSKTSTGKVMAERLHALDTAPLSIHAGDEEGAHPDTCWCSVCAERERRREIEDSMLGHWWENPREIARLYRWLALMERKPAEVADFIEHAQTWERDYRHMLDWQDGRHG